MNKLACCSGELCLSHHAYKWDNCIKSKRVLIDIILHMSQRYSLELSKKRWNVLDEFFFFFYVVLIMIGFIWLIWGNTYLCSDLIKNETNDLTGICDRNRFNQPFGCIDELLRSYRDFWNFYWNKKILSGNICERKTILGERIFFSFFFGSLWLQREEEEEEKEE